MEYNWTLNQFLLKSVFNKSTKNNIRIEGICLASMDESMLMLNANRAEKFQRVRQSESGTSIGAIGTIPRFLWIGVTGFDS